jgi:hypothetical protein
MLNKKSNCQLLTKLNYTVFELENLKKIQINQIHFIKS